MNGIWSGLVRPRRTIERPVFIILFYSSADYHVGRFTSVTQRARCVKRSTAERKKGRGAVLVERGESIGNRDGGYPRGNLFVTRARIEEREGSSLIIISTEEHKRKARARRARRNGYLLLASTWITWGNHCYELWKPIVSFNSSVGANNLIRTSQLPFFRSPSEK